MIGNNSRTSRSQSDANYVSAPTHADGADQRQPMVDEIAATRGVVRIDFTDIASHEGQYVPDDVLPFSYEDCAGTMFRMDNVLYELLGDLGGLAVYRRQNESTIRTMDWANFADAIAKGIIETRN